VPESEYKSKLTSMRLERKGKLSIKRRASSMLTRFGLRVQIPSYIMISRSAEVGERDERRRWTWSLSVATQTDRERLRVRDCHRPLIAADSATSIASYPHIELGRPEQVPPHRHPQPIHSSLIPASSSIAVARE